MDDDSKLDTRISTRNTDGKRYRSDLLHVQAFHPAASDRALRFPFSVLVGSKHLESARFITTPSKKSQPSSRIECVYRADLPLNL